MMSIFFYEVINKQYFLVIHFSFQFFSLHFDWEMRHDVRVGRNKILIAPAVTLNSYMIFHIFIYNNS